ncbi:uncharacterized protein LOC143912861 [Arctopsyche grandis]|uniref:uncharacterized protein LOC143912861 n=1 Tax=Arctopsyche grandis TaxID=121162 RepID=UPI00406D9780
MFSKSLDTAVCCWLCVAGWLFFQVRVVKWWLVRSWMLTGLLLCVDACCCGSTGVVWVVPPFIWFLECLVEVVIDAYERNLLSSRRRIFWNAWWKWLYEHLVC